MKTFFHNKNGNFNKIIRSDVNDERKCNHG